MATRSRRPQDRRIKVANSKFTAVQLFSQGASSNVVWMPIAASQPGLLTLDSLNPVFHPDFPDANARNQDGTQNDADHPAALGSTITLFATGMGATSVPADPGSITHSDTVVAVTPVYATWQDACGCLTPIPESVSTLQGFVSAIFQVRIQVPDPLPSGTTLTNGASRVPVALQFSIPGYSFAPLASNLVEVYLK